MFVKKTLKSNGSVHISIVESVRVGTAIKHKTIRSLGQHKDPRQIAIIEEAAKKIVAELTNELDPVLPCFDPYEFHKLCKDSRTVNSSDKVDILDTEKEQKINTGILDVFGTQYDLLGLLDSISDVKKKEMINKILKFTVMSRLANPCSKRKTSKELRLDFDQDVPPAKIYRMMDKLAENEQRVKDLIFTRTRSLLDDKLDVMFFDVTTLYFESFSPDELRNFGFSKDCKFKETQIVLALMTTAEGLPVSYEVFPGNMHEGKTLIQMIQKLKQTYDLNQVFLVADRGMFNEENLSLMEQEGIEYVVACKLRSLTKAMKNKILDYDWSHRERDTTSTEMEYKSRRLIVEYSDKRAQKDSKDRQRLIERLQKKAVNGKIKVGDLINNHGTKKYINVVKGQATINEEKIESDARWDGLHGIVTNVKGKRSEELLARYRGLWQIEAAFRVNKNDLRMRPIFHWKQSRIRAHILICFIAYTIISHTQFRLKREDLKVSFEELRDELLRTDSVIIREKATGKRFAIPSKVSEELKQIYKVLGVTKLRTPLALEF